MTGALIEGALREVALADVLQLLEMGRKSGVLHVDDPATRRRATIALVGGRIAHATIDGAPALDVREAVIEVLGWSGGRFRVDAADDALGAGRDTIPVDRVLMEAARRADEWARLSDRVPGPDAVPRLAPPSDDGGAPIALSPEEWEVLAYADGAADLRTLATRAGRDVLAIAQAVHRLVGEGLVRLGEEPADEPVPTGDRRSSFD